MLGMVHRVTVVVVVALGLTAPSVRADEPPVAVASIVPLQALLTQVMHGVAKPSVMLPPGASAHHYSLRPSDADRLEKADIVFWIGPSMEEALVKPIEAVAVGVVVVTLMDTPELPLLARRKGGLQQEHNDDPLVGQDPHIWLDPIIAVAVMDEMARALGRLDPERAAIYTSNVTRGRVALTDLLVEVDRTMAPVRRAPYVLFHDAYQYFETRFDLWPAAIVAADPDHAPGARRIAQILNFLNQTPQVCIFVEPQFTPRLIATLTEGTQAYTASLDPVGVTGANGLGDYLNLIRSLARSMRECLQQG